MLNRHAELSNELAVLLRELGDTRQALVQQQASAWEGNAHLGVTERKETVRAHTAPLAAECERMVGEVEALRVLLAHETLRMTYYETLRVTYGEP